MLRGIPTKLWVAFLVTIALVDLHVYLDRYHRRSDMFGSYLRHQVRDDGCGKVSISLLERCREEAVGTGRKIPPTKSSSRVLRG